MFALPIPGPYARMGEVKYFKTWNFSPQIGKIATTIHLSYSLDILIF